MTSTDNRQPLLKAVQAGLIYFIGVFTLAFLFGGIRLLLLVPLLGEQLAVLLEIPVLLVCAWVLCVRAVTLLGIPPQRSQRLIMGITALLLLLLAELVVAVSLFADSLAEFVRGLLSPPGLTGLLGQLLFASFPLLQMQYFRQH